MLRLGLIIIVIDINCIFEGRVEIADNVKIGANCMIGGQVGIVGHITIADGVKIAAQSGVGSNVIQEGAILQGSPAIAVGDYKRSYVLFKNLPTLRNQIQEISRKLDRLFETQG